MNNDFYLNQNNCDVRLAKEWDTHGKLIIGADFDDTLYDCHNHGREYNDILELLKRCKEIGCYIIIITANDDETHHRFIKGYLDLLGLEIDAINENIEASPFRTKKIYCNVLLDDRAGLKSAYYSLLGTAQYMEKKQKGIDIKFYDVWSEGYLVTGMEGIPEPAKLHGTCYAEDFQKACEKIFNGNDFFNRINLTYWGCKLFDNEEDARKSFG